MGGGRERAGEGRVTSKRDINMFEGRREGEGGGAAGKRRERGRERW